MSRGAIGIEFSRFKKLVPILADAELVLTYYFLSGFIG
jgi:hypothetical protein